MMSAVHDRMPVVIGPEGWAAWLGEEPLADPASLLKPFAAERMTMWPVNKAIANVKNQGAELAERVRVAELCWTTPPLPMPHYFGERPPGRYWREEEMHPAHRIFRTLAFAGLLVAASLLLSACRTSFSASVPPGRIKSIALFSALPNHVVLSYRGLTVLNTERIKVDDNFGINEKILAGMQKALAPRYQIVPTTLGTLMPEKASGESDQVAKTGALLRANVKPGAADAIIIAAPMFGVQGDDPLGGFWGSQGSEPRNTAGVAWILEVFDGTTFERIAYSRAMPFPATDAEWHGEPYAQIPAATKAAVKAAIDRSIEGGIPAKLKESGLLL